MSPDWATQKLANEEQPRDLVVTAGKGRRGVVLDDSWIVGRLRRILGFRSHRGPRASQGRNLYSLASLSSLQLGSLAREKPHVRGANPTVKNRIHKGSLVLGANGRRASCRGPSIREPPSRRARIGNWVPGPPLAFRTAAVTKPAVSQDHSTFRSASRASARELSCLVGMPLQFGAILNSVRLVPEQ